MCTASSIFWKELQLPKDISKEVFLKEANSERVQELMIKKLMLGELVLDKTYSEFKDDHNVVSLLSVNMTKAIIQIYDFRYDAETDYLKVGYEYLSMHPSFRFTYQEIEEKSILIPRLITHKADDGTVDMVHLITVDCYLDTRDWNKVLIVDQSSSILG